MADGNGGIVSHCEIPAVGRAQLSLDEGIEPLSGVAICLPRNVDEAAVDGANSGASASLDGMVLFRV